MLVNKIESHSSSYQSNQLSKEEQLQQLMEEYGDMVMRLAYTYLKQREVAEDISQEVFISCYKNLETFQNNSTYKTWLYRITVNKCKDYFRSWSYKNIRYQDLFRSVFKSGDKSVESNVVDKENQEMIFEQVLSLPIKFREVIILHYYEELSINEISILLEINSNTVKTRLHRGRHLLGSFLKEWQTYES
ncbi:sigma-70 family RNA polymerase sigma factor [Neobacillus bataviensis]|uniref:sigma-70 family RNA polymerase sigma factor n=1 Tax=Neobacillus bataviensis TaxID=220685 RepID=UPI001CC17315|nr:sigma-70 family RNA polymerase sigma factor [Neobacillus bataviensis]